MPKNGPDRKETAYPALNGVCSVVEDAHFWMFGRRFEIEIHRHETRGKSWTETLHVVLTARHPMADTKSASVLHDYREAVERIATKYGCSCKSNTHKTTTMSSIHASPGDHMTKVQHLIGEWFNVVRIGLQPKLFGQ